MTEEEAYKNLAEFGNALCADGGNVVHNIRVLIKKRLIGELRTQHYQMWLSGITKPVNIGELLNNDLALNKIKSLRTRMRLADGRGKYSLVVNATLDDGAEYVICKIEPGFDGGENHVSQTKGIIYYFQEGRSLHMPTVWELISRLSEV